MGLAAKSNNMLNRLLIFIFVVICSCSLDEAKVNNSMPTVPELDIVADADGGFRYCFSHNQNLVCVGFDPDDQVDMFSFDQSDYIMLYYFNNHSGVEEKLRIIPGTDTGLKYVYDKSGHLKEIVEYKLYSERVVNQSLEYSCLPDHTNSHFYQIKKTGKNRFKLFAQSKYGGNNGKFIIGKVNSKRTTVIEAESDTMYIKNGQLEFFYEQESFEGVIFIEHVTDSITRGYPVFVSYPKDPNFSLPEF